MNYYIQRLFNFGGLGFFLLISLSFSVYAQNRATTTWIDGSNDPSTVRSQYISSWRQQSNDLQQKINALPSVANFSVYMPVLFGVEIKDISPNFGDSRSNGRTHEGEDIMAVKGTPIVSPTPAVVLRTGVGTGEGNYVYTANPGGETFVYMHLDRFGEGVISGTVLEQGSLIGYVGNTGNASGGAAHLHFEIHNNSGVPTDPFPRLAGMFTLQDKMSYLSKILTQSTDSNGLAQLLVLNFRSTFNSATASGVSIPQIISNFLTSMPDTNPPTGTNLPAGDLTLGSKGTEVARLQQYLITKNIGPSAYRLSLAGPTGNFGPITLSALVEYQVSVGISPANGYYGSATRAILESNLPSAATSASTSTLTRNLYKGIVGEDVRVLQKFLNTHGYVVSFSGAGSAGNETIYFGSATQSAVIQFQVSHNISPAVGYVGIITRSTLVSLGI